MRRILIVLAAMLGFAVFAGAQSRALGFRAAYGNAEIGYEYYVGGRDFIEFEFGTYAKHSGDDDHYGASMTFMYNFVVVKPDWTNRGEWSLYAGPGGGIGFLPHKKNGKYRNRFATSFFGQVGLEYSFWFPLKFSLDVRPGIDILHGNFYGGYPAFSMKYFFK